MQIWNILLASTIEPGQLINNIYPWLNATQQILQTRQLNDAEQKKCLGWLLYSGQEYNMEDLHNQIYLDTGVEVALQI